MKLVLLGAPGAGKGTQAEKLAAYYGIPHVSTGDIFRKNMRDNTALGVQAKEFINNGQLVPDSITEAMVNDRLHEVDALEGYILDGFPRNIEQARAFAGMGVSQLDRVVYLKVDENELVARLSGRRTCPDCGAMYHVTWAAPNAAGRCDRCGALLIQRPDDNETTVRTRLQLFYKVTEPLVAYYEQRGLLLTIDGMQSVNEVAQNIISNLGRTA